MGRGTYLIIVPQDTNNRVTANNRVGCNPVCYLGDAAGLLYLSLCLSVDVRIR